MHALFVWVLALAALLILPSVRLGAETQVSSLARVVLAQSADEEGEPVAADEERDEVEESLLADVLSASTASLVSARGEHSPSPIRRRPPDSMAPPTVDLDPCRKPPGLVLALG